MKVFVGDITAFMEGQNKEMPGIGEKGPKSIKRRWKKRVAGCQSRKEERKGKRSFRSAAREKEWDRTRTKQLGAKEQARRKKCEVWFSCARRNRVFQKDYMRIGARKLQRMGLVARALASSGHRPYRKVEVQEADSGSSRQERVGVVIALRGGE